MKTKCIKLLAVFLAVVMCVLPGMNVFAAQNAELQVVQDMQVQSDSNVIFSMTFDELSSFESTTDFVYAGGYAGAVTLTTEIDHSTGNGKSLKMDDRSKYHHRVRLVDALQNAEIGETYTLSAWVYSPTAVDDMYIGAHSTASGVMNPSVYETYDVPANTWTEIQVEYTHQDTSISQIGFAQWSTAQTVASTIYVDDIVVTKIETTDIPDNGDLIFDMNFDDLTSFVKDTDYAVGGAYNGPVTLTTELDHTTGSGKSLKMADRTIYYHRVKFINALANAEIGETYRLSAWVYSPTAADSVLIGAYESTGNPIEYKEYDIEANTWTKIEVDYKHESESVSQLGIAQWNTSKVLAETLYVDDVMINRIDVEETTLVPVTLREGKRPTPSVTGVGKSYQDLIFYERTFEDERTSEEIFNSLPDNPTVMANNADMMNALFVGPEYGELEEIQVEGMPFTTAIRATVDTVPAHAYDMQLELESLDSTQFNNGDSMLIVFYMRTISAGNEVNMGQVQLIVEQEVAPNKKVLQEDVKTISGGGWKKVYLPFAAQQGYTRLCIRFGYYEQTVEIGGYEILNYGTNVDFADLPSDTVMDIYDKQELFDRNVDWRIDAWNRIETIRKGDINVIVKDEDGNVVPNAAVTIDMYDHEFKWGTAVNSYLTQTGSYSDKYREAVATFFNTAVSTNDHKPGNYISDPTISRNQVDKAKELGLKYFRGHALVWDKGLSVSYNAETDSYISNSAVPEPLMRLELARVQAEETGDETELARIESAIDDYIKNQLIKVRSEEFAGDICEWDVLNETVFHNELRSAYGMQVVKKWYDWAKQYDSNAKRYINEYGIVGIPENGYLTQYKAVLDEMIEAEVDFDGIGVQGHFGTFVSPEAFYNELCQLAEYGKELKITELDCSLDMHSTDEEAEASFIRDILILAYSMAEMDGVLMWGFDDESHWGNNAILFDKDWNLKLSGEQFMDLVYNKWWTAESGVTNSEGVYTVKGYYGDYLITATADGKTVTSDVQCYAGDGSGNTVEIILMDAVEEEPTEGEIIYSQSFDDLNTFEKNVDYVCAGGYKKDATLSIEQDHTTGSGKSLKIAERTAYSHRIKINGALSDAEVGETYTISAWVYSPIAVDRVYIGAHSTASGVMNPTVYSTYDVPANTWTKIEVEYTHQDSSVSQIGFAQYHPTTTVAPTLYVDDIVIVKKEQ